MQYMCLSTSNSHTIISKPISIPPGLLMNTERSHRGWKKEHYTILLVKDIIIGITWVLSLEMQNLGYFNR